MLVLVYKAEAISPTSTPTPTKAGQSAVDQVSQLKDKIASRVAQLKLVEKRGIVGTVTEVMNTQISLVDTENNIRLVDVDELTKFSSSSAKGSFGISDIKKNTTIGVLGIYNKESRRILARFVNVLNLDKKLWGGIKEIDTKNFTLTIVTDDKKTYVIDNEPNTKIQIYSKTSGSIKGGFSKLESNKWVLVSVYTNPKTGKLSASRILEFTDVPLTAENPLSQNPVQVSPTATSGAKIR